MGSSTVKAQKLANQANLEITDKTNQMQRDLAQQANDLNYQMFQEQNAWNLARRDEEWAYNDPSAQMDRLIKAGINPIFGMGNGSAGQAQQLTSAEAKPAEVAQMQRAEVNPEYDPMLAQHVGNIVAVARDQMNAALGRRGLELQEQDVNTRARAQVSQAMLNKAAAAEKRANTTGKEIENEWNLQTFSVRAKAESQKLSNMWMQYNKLDADTELAKSQKLNIEASTDLIRQKITESKENLKLRKEELQVAWANAGTNAKAVQLESDKFASQIKQWNNENLLNFMYKFGDRISGGMNAKVGIEGLGYGMNVSGSKVLPASQAMMIECGIEILDRYQKDPSNEKLAEAAGKAVNLLNSVTTSDGQSYVVPPSRSPEDEYWNAYNNPYYNSSNTSVLNPSGF